MLGLAVRVCYHRAFFPAVGFNDMLELSPIFTHIKDMQERVDVLRGYL